MPGDAYSIAHLSDLHATPVRAGGPLPLLNKRALGWLSWRLKRHKHYQTAVLEALIDDLATPAPDQIVVTGDLTNVALESEFPAARRWLERLGDATRVTAIPGNHDAYVRVARARSWDLWSEYMASDAPAPGAVAGDDGVEFPTLRVRGPVAFVGVCSAQPTAPLRASGAVGDEQLARLGRTLEGLADTPLCRIVLIHHPPVPGLVSRRRALLDAEAFGAVLRRAGAELVLHGHMHRVSIASLAGPAGTIPVVCVPASSNVGHNPEKRSRYHLVRVEPTGGRGFRLGLRARGYDPGSGRFVDEGERSL